MKLFNSPEEYYRYSKAAGKRFILALFIINIIFGFKRVENKPIQATQAQKQEIQIKKVRK